ncbi:MAG: type II toxin-antitoxin system HicB family antitoxin [Sideroxydans sp.]|nr:type II toxin-antitoxin system HicB family antitoxin [Sideroxydans sp.]
MKTYDYAFKFTKDDDGWVITCRDLPEAISQADANEDRIDVAQGCLQAALESRIRDNESLPVASKLRRGEVEVSPPAATAAKAALYDAMREAGISKSELAHRLGVDEKEVRRMLDAGHGTKLPRIAEAVEALGRHLHIALV